jgi:hypothetical protein
MKALSDILFIIGGSLALVVVQESTSFERVD